MIAHEFHEQLKLGTIDRLAEIGGPHVVNDSLGGRRSEEVPQLGQIHRFKVDNDMPTKFFDAAGDLDQLLPRCEVNKTLDEVEAHTTHASVMHFRSSVSLMLRLTVAMPRTLPPECMSA